MNDRELQEIENLGKELFTQPTSEIDFINEIDDERQANATYIAHEKDPIQAASDLRLSQQLGVHNDFVERNREYLTREKKRIDLNNSLSQMREDAPKAAEFLLDPTNLSLAQNELQAIADIEKTVNEHSVASKAYSSLATGMGQLYSGLAKIPGGVYAIGALPQNLVARYFPETGLSEVAPPDWLLNNPIAKHYDERALEWANLNPDAQKSITSEVMSGNYKDAGKTLAYQVIQNAPTTLGLLATSWAGFPTQGLVTAGASAGSQHLDETLKQGASPTQATVAGVGSGVFESVFESLGLSKLKGWEHALEKELGRELLKSEKKAVYTSLAKTLSATALTEGTSEGATELSTRLTDYLSGAVPDFSTKEAFMASADAFAVGLGSSVTTSIPSTSLVARMRIADINQAKANQKLFVDLATKSANLKLLEQSPEKHKEMLDSLTQGTNIENVSFSKEAFDGLFQTKGEEPAKAALELGIEKEYAEAEKTGADITMKTSDAITKLAKSDVVPELSNHMKFGEDPHSVHELNQTQNEMRETLETLEKQAKENQLPSFEKQIQEIRKDLQSQLEETGMPRKEAIKNAMLAAETVRVDSLNMNEQPQDLWSKYKFGVTNEGVHIGDEVFYQDGKQVRFQDLAIQSDFAFPNEIAVTNLRDTAIDLTPEMPKGKIEIPGKKVFNRQTGFQFSLGNTLGRRLASKEERIVLNNIDGLMQRAVLIHKYNPTNRLSELRSIFYSPFTIGKQSFVARLITRQQNGQYQIERIVVDKQMREVPQTSDGDVSTAVASKVDGMTENKSGPANKISLTDFMQQIKAIRQEGPADQTETNELGFYSKLIQTVEDKMGNTQDVKSLNAMLRDIKPEERKWLGLDTFLEGKEKVSKAELLDFLRGNMLQVKEVSKGAPISKAEALEAAKSGQNVWALEMQSGDPLTPERIEADIDEAQFILGGQGTKFENYKTSGGENYREILFTLPFDKESLVQDVSIIQNTENGEWDVKRGDRTIFSGTDESEAIEYKNELANERASNGKGQYKSSHWDEKNVLAHTRLQDFTDAEGKRVLMVEEIQSDWHQEGRKKGYRGDEKPFNQQEYNDLKKKVDDAELKYKEKYSIEHRSEYELKKYIEKHVGKESLERLAELHDLYYKTPSTVPDAPFKKTWHEFVFKRIARMAAEQGYDKIAWTTGEQQADRYDLSKQVDSVGAFKKPDGTFDIEVMRDGRIVMEKSGVAENQLDEMVGKDLAAKIINEDGKQEKSGFRIYSGLDLKVGGEGMKGFYDKILVDYAKKFGKKFGAKVESYTLQESSSFSYYASKDGEGSGAVLYKVQGTGSIPQPIEFYDTIEQAKEAANRLNEQAQTKVHSLEVTPEMRESIMSEGLPLFQGDGIKQGAFDPKTFMIHLFQAKDKSTFIHELGHTRLFLLDKYIRDGLATPQMIESMNEALKYVGAESFEKMTTEQHEKFARSLEAYMLEGKAPNKRLAKLFADIKAWFLDTYSKYFGNPQDHASAIKEALGVELTPEIREVFDRMFVSQNEIEKNQPKPMFADPAILQVLSEKESLEYLDAAEWARIEAEADLQAKLMKDVLRKSKADYKAKFSELQEKHLNDAKDMQVFRALEGIKEQYKLDASVIANEFKEFKGKLPRGLTTSEDGGLRPDFVAGIYGYESATKMLEDLSNHRMGISQFVENNVLNEMKTHFPELLESPELQREAVTSAYNEGIAKMKRQELEILATKDFPTLKKVSAKLIARLPRMGDVVAEAKSLIENKSFDELKPYKYQQAEKRFAKEASKAFVKGDIEGAFEAKRMEYLNFELYREALRAQDQVSKDLKFFKKIYKADEELAKGRDTDIINAARAVLAEFGVTRSEKTASEWLSKMKAYDRGRYNSLQVLIGAATNKAGQLNEIPLGKFFEMSNAVHALWELSKIENEYKVQGETLAFDSVKDQVVAHLESLSSNPQVGVQRKATSLDKFNVALLGVKGSLTRLEPYFKALGGPMYDLVWTKIIDAQTKMQSRNEKQVKAFVEIFEPIRETLKEKKTIYAPELNYEFAGAQELLGALLHRGNESNFAKLIVGNKWGEIDEQGKLDSSRFEAFEKRMIKEGVLTKEHYQFVQNVWNLLEESKADAQKAHKRMFGYYFEEITAKPFTNEFGTFEGGYFPAVADPYKVDKASQHQEADDLLNVNNNFMFPSSNKGFTKERAANYFAPLIMDLNQVPSHLKKVSTFIELGPEVRDTARLFYSPRVQEVYRNIDQGAIPEMIIPWLQRVAQQKLPISGTGQGWRFMDNVATYLRSSTGLQTMAFNFINAMQNFTQLPSVLTRTQISSMRDALAVFIQNPKKASELMYEKSEFMRNRKGSLVIEAYDTLNDLLENPSHAQDSVNFVRQNARFMSEFSQGLVESISWLSGYKDALALGKTEEQAIKNADSVVRLTQGGFSLAEVSRFEAGSPAMRIFTIFYGFFNAVLNNNVGKATEIMRGMGLKKGASHLFFLYLVGFMVPAILNDAFGIALGGGDWDEDKDGDYADDFLNLFFGSQFNLGVAMMPFGQVAKSSVNAFNNKPYDDKISMSPAIGMVERSMQAPASLYKAIEGEGSPKKAVTDVLTLIGMLTKTPVAPIAKPINYLIDVQTGNTQPTGPIDFSRGLLTGKGKK